MRSRPVLLLPLLLAGCIPAPHGGGESLFGPRDDAASFRRCLADFAELGAKVQPLADRTYPNGCSAERAVKLVAVGTPITNLGAMKCGLALAFTEWMQQVVPSAASDRLKARVVKVESYGTFACRPINGQEGNRLSEHGKANAVDIAGFVLSNGRRVTIRDGWDGPDPDVRAFLRQVRDGACRRFNIVLSPDYNALHRDHLHFDMGSGRYCR